jgi:hypothetical protein
MLYIPSFHECRSCDFTSDEPFAICPLCSCDTVTPARAKGTDFQTGFRFAMRLMERTGHRIDTKELFDTLSDLAMGIMRIETADPHSKEANQALALRMLRVLDDEARVRNTARRPKLLGTVAMEKAPAYA